MATSPSQDLKEKNKQSYIIYSIMQCILCEKNIENYNEKFNRLVINDYKTVNICMECIHKLAKWQQEIFIEMFPTKVAKKWLKQKKETINI